MTDRKEFQQHHNEDEHERPAAPLAGIVYGDVVYWLTIVATVVVIIGSIVTFTTHDNYIHPNDLLSAIWQGKDVEAIWKISHGSLPDGHWYLSQLTTGNGLTAGGIALGVFSVIPGILGAAFVLYRQKQILFASLAIVAAIITSISVII
ncbi:MAG: DUF1634 domain-containing protein [Gammaproteobacteria bacterium]